MSQSKELDENELEGFQDWKGRPARKDCHGGIQATLFIYATQLFEILGFLAINVNLVTYFNGVMNMNLSDAATMLTNFVGTALLLSLVGGFVSDAYLDRFKTNFLCACTELIGYTVLLIQAHYESLKPPPCNPFDQSSVCEKLSGGNAVMLFVGLYLVGIGSGCMKGALPAFGADQFDEKDPKEKRKISTYFNMLFLSISVGSCIGVTVVVWVMTNKGWDAGFGFCLASVFIATVALVAGKSKYCIRIPGGSPLTRIFQVFVAAFGNRHLSTPENPNDLYEVHDNKHPYREIAHTNQFRFMDKAAILRGDSSQFENGEEVNGWRLCTVTQVEEAKILVRMVPIFSCTILLSTGLAQLQTFSVSQGLTMDRSMGKHFDIPAPSLAIIPFLFLVILTPIYDRIFVPVARRFTGHEAGITHLQRIGIGLVLALIAMSIAAVVEILRKNVAIENGMVDAIPILMPPIPMSVFWLGFQYFIFGVADLFTLVGTMEFFYSEAPERMRSMATSFAYVSLSVGFFFSTFLVKIVNAVTRDITESHGWLGGNNLNRNHLDLFFWLLAFLLLLNFFNYLFWSRWYKHKPLAVKREDNVPVKS